MIQLIFELPRESTDGNKRYIILNNPVPSVIFPGEWILPSAAFDCDRITEIDLDTDHQTKINSNDTFVPYTEEELCLIRVSAEYHDRTIYLSEWKSILRRTSIGFKSGELALFTTS